LTDRRFDAVVFDFGGVLITPITNKLSILAQRGGVSVDQMLELLMGPRYESTPDHPWHRAERGEVAIADLQELVAPFAAEAGIALHGDEMDLLFEQNFSYNRSVIDRIAALRDQGYRTALLTNSMKEFRPVLAAGIDLDRFDLVVDSSEVGLRKPEPEIYRHVTDALAVDPERIVYLDDFAHNLGPALEIGWTVIHVTGPEQALSELDHLLSHPGD
jgi:epoxide hydrolase-like predicted phosphatase